MNWTITLVGLTIILLPIASIVWLKNKKRSHTNTIEVVSIIHMIVATVVAIITVWVMFMQKDMQQMVIDMQKQEHQPSFEIDYKRHSISNLEFEDFSIVNNGECFKSISVSTETFISVDYFNFSTNTPEINTYIKVADYYGSGQYTGAITDKVYYRILGGLRNTEMLKNWVEESRQYNQAHIDKFYLLMRSYVIITYVDIYGDSHVEYFLNGTPCTEQSYKNVCEISQSHFGNKSRLKSFYMSEIEFPDILLSCAPICDIIQQVKK